MDHWEEWQKVYQYGTLVIWPPDTVRDVVSRQREEFDPKSASICQAHITLTQPLLQPLDSSKSNELSRIASTFHPFEVRYGPLKSFLPYPCIWYNIHPVNEILEIREALHRTGFFDLSLPHTEGFIPHMTITEGLSGPEVNERLLEDLQARSRPGKFIFSEITLIKPDEEFSFNAQRKYALGRTAQG